MKKALLFGGIFVLFLGGSFTLAKTDILVTTTSGIRSVFFSEKFGEARTVVETKNPFLAVEKFSAPRPSRDSGLFGVTAAEFTGEKTPDFSIAFSSEFALLQRIDALLALDITTEISQGNRGEKLLAIERELTAAEAEATKSLTQINAKASHFFTEAQNRKENYSALESAYSTSFDTRNAGESAKNFDEIIAEKQKYIAANENAKKANSLADEIDGRIPQIQSRKNAIAANRAALIAGITVDGSTARSVGLIR